MPQINVHTHLGAWYRHKVDEVHLSNCILTNNKVGTLVCHMLELNQVMNFYPLDMGNWAVMTLWQINRQPTKARFQLNEDLLTSQGRYFIVTQVVEKSSMDFFLINTYTYQLTLIHLLLTNNTLCTFKMKKCIMYTL